MFQIHEKKIDVNQLRQTLLNQKAGAFTSFEGWVRNHNDGFQVASLEYEVYTNMALKEGMKIINQAIDQFDIAWGS